MKQTRLESKKGGISAGDLNEKNKLVSKIQSSKFSIKFFHRFSNGFSSFSFKNTNNGRIAITGALVGEFKKLKVQALQCFPDCGHSSTVKPVWFDQIKFDVGRHVAKRHFFVVFVCHLLGLIALVHYLPVMRTLLATGRSRNLRSLFWRYLHTALKVRLWYEGDLWNPEDQAYESIQQVRVMHQQASRQRNSRTATVAGNILLFSQYDMYMTQVSAFIQFFMCFMKI